MGMPMERSKPKSPRQPSGRRWTALGLAAALVLSACNEEAPPPAAQAVVSPAPQLAASYTPPPAETLYQMVAPIALYPDKLVAQVLAASTYPDQVAAAEVWIGQNPGLRKTALAEAVDAQPWDPSVKSLTAFPNVLGQMAGNLPWITALGKAYYNDPADVFNAIQAMRGRAYAAGTLKTSPQMKVSVASQPGARAYTPSYVPAAPLAEPVIAPPGQFIEIEPAAFDTVYVPQYDPGVVYGAAMPVYAGYRYFTPPPPPPAVGIATPVVAGLIGFGAGVLLTQAVDSRPWGWQAWNMHWGAPGPRWRPGNPPPPPLALPAVAYRNQTYVSQSRSVVQNNPRVNNFQGAPMQPPRPDTHGTAVRTGPPAMPSRAFAPAPGPQAPHAERPMSAMGDNGRGMAPRPERRFDPAAQQPRPLPQDPPRQDRRPMPQQVVPQQQAPQQAQWQAREQAQRQAEQQRAQQQQTQRQAGQQMQQRARQQEDQRQARFQAQQQAQQQARQQQAQQRQQAGQQMHAMQQQRQAEQQAQARMQQQAQRQQQGERPHGGHGREERWRQQ